MHIETWKSVNGLCRCLKNIRQGIYKDVHGSWNFDFSGSCLVSNGFFGIRNVQYIYWKSRIMNLKSLCASEVVLLQGVSKSSSKESKRTSGVPGWCQFVSLTWWMFNICIGDAINRIWSLYVHQKWCFSKVSPNRPPRSLRGRLGFLAGVNWFHWRDECSTYALELP